jgi:hypothetical protein
MRRKQPRFRRLRRLVDRDDWGMLESEDEWLFANPGGSNDSSNSDWGQAPK